MPADGKHWKRLLEALPKLKAIGIDNIWLPPGCKASSPNGNGYDIYDLYDLGEFNQKGSRATKWGTKEELMELTKLAKELGVGLYWDAVLNHKAAADNKEKCKVVEVDLNGTLVDVHSTSPLWMVFNMDLRTDPEYFRPHQRDFRAVRDQGMAWLRLSRTRR